jgi:hypothetical protein
VDGSIPPRGPLLMLRALPLALALPGALIAAQSIALGGALSWQPTGLFQALADESLPSYAGAYVCCALCVTISAAGA